MFVCVWVCECVCVWVCLSVVLLIIHISCAAYKTVGSFYQETGNLREAEEMYRQCVLILEQTAPGHILNAGGITFYCHFN